MVRVVVAARSNRVSPTRPVIVSDYLIGYLLSGDGRRPLCHQTLLVAVTQLFLRMSRATLRTRSRTMEYKQ